jgi:hypothetical protein
MQFDNIVEENLSNRVGCVRVLQRKEVTILQEPIHNHQYNRISMRNREPFYKV